MLEKNNLWSRGARHSTGWDRRRFEAGWLSFDLEFHRRIWKGFYCFKNSNCWTGSRFPSSSDTLNIPTPLDQGRHVICTWSHTWLFKSVLNEVSKDYSLTLSLTQMESDYANLLHRAMSQEPCVSKQLTTQACWQLTDSKELRVLMQIEVSLLLSNRPCKGYMEEQ